MVTDHACLQMFFFDHIIFLCLFVVLHSRPFHLLFNLILSLSSLCQVPLAVIVCFVQPCRLVERVRGENCAVAGGDDSGGMAALTCFVCDAGADATVGFHQKLQVWGQQHFLQPGWFLDTNTKLKNYSQQLLTDRWFPTRKKGTKTTNMLIRLSYFYYFYPLKFNYSHVLCFPNRPLFFASAKAWRNMNSRRYGREREKKNRTSFKFSPADFLLKNILKHIHWMIFVPVNEAAG